MARIISFDFVRNEIVIPVTADGIIQQLLQTTFKISHELNSKS